MITLEEVKKEYNTHTCYPAYDNIFNALKYTMMFNRIDTSMKEHHVDKYFSIED